MTGAGVMTAAGESHPKGKSASLLPWLDLDGWWDDVIADVGLGGWRENSDFASRWGWE